MSKQDIDFKIGADLKQFRSAMGNIDHSLKRLSGGFGALGGVIGASFAVDAIRQFVSESVNLAAQAEGVKAAFDRMNNPQLLDNLRKATAGTVDDLKLMQTAVQAKNFRIPMDVLAKGLEFAQRRAQETGQSVDYMVDSFVTGLGRESVKILDNLGISTIELNKKNKELGSMAAAVGAIMDAEMAKAGDRVETVSMKLDQQRAAVTNLKTEVGEKLAPIYMGVTKGGLEFVNAIANTFEQFTKGYAEMFRSIGLLERQQDKFGKSISETGKKRIETEEKALFNLNAMLKSLQDNNLEEDQRRILINKINTEYKDYLPNLLTEKQTLEDIRDVAREVNQTAKEKINQIILQEQINKATEDGVQAQKDLNELTVKQSKMKAKGGVFAMTSEEIKQLAASGENLGHAFNSASAEVITMEKAVEDARDRLIFAEMTINGLSKKLLGLEENTGGAGEETDNLAVSFEATRTEADRLAESVALLQTHLDGAFSRGGALINQFATASTSFKEFKKTWEDNVIQQGLKEGVDLTYILADAGFDAFTAFEELGNSIGNLLTSSFEAAMISGEDFFKVFIQGLKNMVAQLLATIAAALVLAVILAALPLGLAGVNMQSIGTAFKLFSGPMMGVPSFGLGGGLGGAMQGGGLQVFGRLSGSDILISSERAGRDRTRLSGITG